MRRWSGVAAVAAAGLALAEPAAAQWETFEGSRGRAVAGGHLALAIPVGEFQNYVDAGGGLGGFFLYNFDPRGLFGLRLDGSFLVYGRENRQRPLSPTVPLITVDVTTQNEIVWLAVGPQLTLRTSPVRPYLNAGVGISYFATRSSVRGTGSRESFAETTNFDDLTFAWHSGAGVWVRLSRGRTPVYLDLSSRYVLNGRVRYLREGSIQEEPDGTVTFTPIESETNLWLLQMGIAIGVG